MANIIFHRTTERDAEALIDFERLIADPKIYGAPIADLKKAKLEIAAFQFYFLRRDTKTIGTAAYKIRADGSAYIGYIAVHPDCRRQGIGKAAMEFILEKTRHSPRRELVTHPDNRNALQLYGAMGFRVEARRENYFGDGEPRLVLALT